MNIFTSISTVLLGLTILATNTQVQAKGFPSICTEAHNPATQNYAEASFQSKLFAFENQQQDWNFISFEKEWDCELLSNNIVEMSVIEVIIEVKNTESATKTLAPLGEQPRKHGMTLTEAIWQIEEVGLGATY